MSDREQERKLLMEAPGTPLEKRNHMAAHYEREAFYHAGKIEDPNVARAISALILHVKYSLRP